MLRHGGSQPCAVEGAAAPRTSRQERRGVLEYSSIHRATLVIEITGILRQRSTKIQKAKKQKKGYFVETNRIRGILIQRVL